MRGWNRPRISFWQLRPGNAEVSMPTQNPAKQDPSWKAEAKAALVDSLLAAAIIYVIMFIVVWAYT